MGKHKVKCKNPYTGDLRALESAGKKWAKVDYDPLVEAQLPKVVKPRVSTGKNPFEGDLKSLESYGKGLKKGKYSPVVKAQLPKKPKLPC
jgi:hypothetical protein